MLSRTADHVYWLGRYAERAENLARTDIVIVGILVIGMFGVALDRVGRILARRMAPWIRSELDLGRA
mgnify:CR=1 FL=1